TEPCPQTGPRSNSVRRVSLGWFRPFAIPGCPATLQSVERLAELERAATERRTSWLWHSCRTRRTIQERNGEDPREVFRDRIDNSLNNPSNPDSKAELFWGEQTWEEMNTG